MSFVLGLGFIFVRAPHPWGTAGFDHYHEIALELASGRPFPTMEVPWGYAYFLAAFYRLFGDRVWIPLVVQVALNALMPLLVFEFARTWLDRTTATLAAVLTGLLSFNTVYASTQSSDAICTVLFMTAVLSFDRARRRDSLWWFGLVGALLGIATQFRPNLLLLPLLFAAYAVAARPRARGPMRAVVVVGCAAAVLMPWVARNYRLTRSVLPTSVHGGVQLWYGTLQVGPYLRSRAHNPRSLFEAPAFEYTSLENVPIVVEAQANCKEEALVDIGLAYWSDENPRVTRIAPARTDDRHYTFEIPAPGREAVIYYYFVTTWSGDQGTTSRTTPPDGERTPLIYFVSPRHLADLDVHGDLLDVFDVVRLMRHAAWNEPLPFAERLRAVGATDAKAAVDILMRRYIEGAASTGVAVENDAATARLRFTDGSRLEVPRQWSGRVTDIAISEGAASTLMTSRMSMRLLEEAGRKRLTGTAACTQVGDVAVNEVFYRKEPHMMRRYLALAMDNISRDPIGFVQASAYRAVRLFVIEGTSDPSTNQQFSRSGYVYAVGGLVTTVFLGLVGLGVLIAWRRNYRFGLPLLLIASIPATLAPVLTNMRYTVTVQPLMFMFVAIAITAMRRVDPVAEHQPFAG
jgi:hypothetical protein